MNSIGKQEKGSVLGNAEIRERDVTDFLLYVEKTTLMQGKKS